MISHQATIENLGPDDTLTLNGGGGGDEFDVTLDVSQTFAIDIKDSPSSTPNTLLIDGSGYTQGYAGVAAPKPQPRQTALSPLFNNSQISYQPVFSNSMFAYRRKLSALPAIPIIIAKPLLVEADSVVVASPRVTFAATVTELVSGAAKTTSASVRFDANIDKLTVLAPDSVAPTIRVGSTLHVAQTVVQAGKGGDTFDVLGFLGKLTLLGGAGNDTFNILPFIIFDGFTGHRDFVGGPLVIDGKGGRDVVNLDHVELYNTGEIDVSDTRGLVTLNIDDSNDSRVRDVTIRATTINGFAPSFINYVPTDLAALNIIGTRGFQRGRIAGRLASPPRYNTYNIVGTPGVNSAGVLVTTTLTVLGAGGDTVSVLAASDKHLRDKGVQGTLRIISPNHLTDLRVYGYVTPANATAGGGNKAILVTSATGKKARRLQKAAQLKSVKLFKSLLVATKTASRIAKISLVAKPAAASKAKKAIKPNGNGSKAAAPFPLPTPPVVIDSDHISGLTPGDIQYGAGDLVSLKVTTPVGGQVVYVLGTPNQGAVGSVVTSLIGHGRDLVYVGSPSLARVRGALNISNPLGRSAVTVDGSGDSAKQDATVKPGLISGLAPAEISYEVQDVTTLDLRGGTGGNTFRISGSGFRPTILQRAGAPVTLDGGSGANTLSVADAAYAWNVASRDAGSVGQIEFSRVGSLVGGSLADTFRLADGASLGGSLDGGGGADTLDMSAQSRDVAVDLKHGVATAISGRVTNIANAVGGRRNNLLVGDAKANVLQGGGGRNVLIGEGGADQIRGGSGDNALIGGRTGANVGAAALDAVMAEFARSDEDFLTRLTHLLSGNGVNDPTLINPSTILGDGAANVLTAGAGQNWFLSLDGSGVISPTALKKGDVLTPLVAR